MKAHKLFGSSKLILIALLLVGGLTVSAVTYADSILPSFGIVSEGSFFSALSRTGPTTPQVSQSTFEPSVSTDRDEYAPGQAVQISGSGFAPGQDVTLLVVHVEDASKISGETKNAFDHSGHTSWQTSAREDGTFSSSWEVGEDCYGVTLKLTADQGGLHAETTFRDAIGFNKGVYNKDDFPPDSTGDWTTGNAGDNYLEGQWVSYQYQVAGIGSGNPTPSFDITFNHYQQNVDALFIDAFANFRACVDCEEDSFTSGPKEGMLLDDVPYPSTSTVNWKSAIGAISFINGTLDANGQCVATEDPVNTPSQEHCFHVDGTALQALFPGVNFSSGNHTITLFYSAHLAASRTWRNGQQHLLGCTSSPHYVAPGPEVVPANTVYGTSAYSGGDPCSQDNAGDWTESIQGVGFATGSSRQFNITNQTAGPSGALSLPIPSVIAPTGSVTIVKVTDPTPAAGSVFGFGGDFGPFNLDTDPSATNSHTVTFTDVAANVPLTVTELSMPSGWELTNVVCTGAGTFTYPTYGATVTLNSTNGASVTCTFTNTQQRGSIQLVKQTVGGIPGKAYSWPFTTVGFAGGSVTLNTTGANQTASSAEYGNLLVSGTYSVTEGTLPFGWFFTSAVCKIDGNTVSSVATNVSLNIPVQANKTTICTYVNTESTDTRGKIIVDKVTVPSGDAQSFTFTPTGFNGGNTFPLTDAATPFDSGFLIPTADGGGPYSVSEGPVSGWDLTNSTCTSSLGHPADNPSSINLAAGEIVTCTFTNTKRPDISVAKTAVQTPVSAGTAIGFTITVTNLGPTTANGVVLTDTLPTNAGLVWSIDAANTTAPGCAMIAGILTCNIGTMTFPSSVQVRITSPTTAATCGTVNNTGTVSATNETPGATANNSAGASIVVNCPDVRVQKTAANTPINAGQVASFTITVSNIGAGTATGVTLSDPLPAGIAWAITGGTGAASCVSPIVGTPLTLSCNFGDMAAGASFTVIVSGTTDAADCGTLNNTASASATNEGAGVLANNSASASIVVNCGRIIIDKVTDPADDPQEFSFSGAFTPELTDDDAPFDSGAIAPGQYVVTEGALAGWDLTNLVCNDANSVENVGTRTATINVEGNETVTCTFTNTKRGTVSITKTYEGGAIPEGESFQFQLRSGASAAADGTVLADVMVDHLTTFPLQLNGSLVPGPYQVCEYVRVGWDSTIRTMTGAFVPNSLANPAETDNSFVCVPVTIDPGENETVVIDNTPPPGGMAKTIGFWKNHASCKDSNGKQDPVLDDTLAGFPIAEGETNPGFYIGFRYVDTCVEAVTLLNKSIIGNGGGKGKGGKAASDPAFNMAAQLVAAILNIEAGAGDPGCVDKIIADAQGLLEAVQFNGSAIPNYGNGALGSRRKSQMNYLAGLLDAYNNNTLSCGSYTPIPLPY